MVARWDREKEPGHCASCRRPLIATGGPCTACGTPGRIRTGLGLLPPIHWLLGVAVLLLVFPISSRLFASGDEAPEGLHPTAVTRRPVQPQEGAASIVDIDAPVNFRGVTAVVTNPMVIPGPPYQRMCVHVLQRNMTGADVPTGWAAWSLRAPGGIILKGIADSGSIVIDPEHPLRVAGVGNLLCFKDQNLRGPHLLEWTPDAFGPPVALWRVRR